MSFWTAMVAIAAIWGFVALYRSRHDRHVGVIRDDNGNPVFPPRTDEPLGSPEMRREVEQLRERVKVLERIVTDDAGPRSLAHEIENLREKD
jgi:hypothetical protein